MVVALLVFPYLLYSFTCVFDRPSRRLRIAVSALTAAMIVWTLALPRFPAPEESYPWWFIVFLGGFLVHWLVVSTLVALRLWEAGRGQPTVSRRRMQALALGAGGITAAIFLIASRADPEAPAAIIGGLLAVATGLAFLFGLAPLQAVRA